MALNLKELLKLFSEIQLLDDRENKSDMLKKNLPQWIGQDKTNRLLSSSNKIILDSLIDSLNPKSSLDDLLNGLKKEATLRFESAYGFDEKAQSTYRRLRPLSILLSMLEGAQHPLTYSYKLSLAFENPSKALDYLNRYMRKNKGSESPLHDACQYNLPSKSSWNLKTWRSLAANHLLNPKFQMAFGFADKIEKFQKDEKKYKVFLEKEASLKLLKQEQELSTKAKKQFSKFKEQHQEVGKNIHAFAEKVTKEHENKLARQIQKLKELAKDKWKDLSKQITEEALAQYKKRIINKQKKIAEIVKNGEKAKEKLAGKEAIIKTLRKSYSITKNPRITPEVLYHLATASGYDNYDKAPKAASTLLSMGVPEQHFDTYLKLLKKEKTAPKKSDHLLPNIVVDGGKYGLKNYFICKISANDPKAPFLGYPTGCCQSIGSEGEECAIFGMSQPNSGFYALCKGKPPKAPLKDTTDLINPKQILAMTWAWRNEGSSTVVFDNVEANDNASQTKEQKNRIRKMVTALAYEITEAFEKKESIIQKVQIGSQLGIKRIGYGKKLKGKFKETLRYQQNNKKYNGYTDAKKQTVVYDKERPFYGLAVISPHHEVILQIELASKKNQQFFDKIELGLLFQQLVKNKLSAKEVKKYLQVIGPENVYKISKYVGTWALKNDSQEIKNYLINQLISIIKKDTSLLNNLLVNTHTTIFDLAIIFNETEIVNNLLNMKELNIDAGKTGYPPLSLAYEYHSFEVFELLIKSKKIDVNKPNGWKRTVLQDACAQNKKNIVKLLLKHKKIKVNKVGKTNGMTPLLIACENNRKEIVEMLLGHKDIKVNEACGFDKATPLFRACKYGRKGIVKMLLGHKDIKVNEACGFDKGTPLHIAYDNNNKNLISMLLDIEDIDIYQPDWSGLTVLHKIIKDKNKEMLDVFLRAKKIDINALFHQSKETALHYACKLGEIDIVERLLNVKDIDVNKLGGGYRNETPLYTACKNGHKEIVKLLLKAEGIDLNRESGKKGLKETVLFRACLDGSDDIVRTLIKEDSLEINKSGWLTKCTALHIACFLGENNIVEMLLKVEGIKPNQLDKYGSTAFHMACLHGHKGIVERLLQIEEIKINDANLLTDETPLYLAAKNGHTKTVKLLLEKGAKVNAVSALSPSPINKAVKEGHKKVVQLLLDYGADVNKAHGKKCYTPLHMAIKKGNLKIASQLLKADANCNIRDFKHRTPLLLAVKLGENSIAKKILKKQPGTVNKRDKDGLTALHIAALLNNKKMVEQLIKAGAKVDIESYDTNETPLDIAVRKGKEKIVKLLISKNDKEINGLAKYKAGSRLFEKANAMACLKPKMNEIQFKNIKEAVSMACDKYKAFVESLSDDNPQYSMSKKGFFTRIRHGKKGLFRAKDLKNEIENTSDFQEVINVINKFFNHKNLRFHRHSLTTFVLNEINKLENSPWKKINSKKNIYNKKEVLSKYTPRA